VHFTQNRSWIVSLFSAAGLLGLTGCFSNRHSSSHGIALSDAMAASASGNSSGLSHAAPAPTHSPDESFLQSLIGGLVADETTPAEVQPVSEPLPEGTSTLVLTGGVAGSATLTNGATDSAHFSEPDSGEGYVVSFAIEELLPIANDIRHITRFEIVPVALQDEESYVGVFIGGGDVQFRSSSFPEAAITDTWFLDVGIMGRHYFTPPKTFFSPYFTGGIFGQVMFWDYRTPLNVNGEIVQTDSLYGGGGFVGFGVAIARKETLGIFVETRLGFSLYDDASMRGFYNDVLEGYGYVSFRAGVSVKF
jgi:hypothetical protein